MASTSDFHPNKIAIYSIGLLGGSLGLALKESGFAGGIVGMSSPKSQRYALDLGCVDEAYGYDSLADVVSDCDLLCLCSPIEAIKDCLRRLGDMDLPTGLVVTDVGSTKREIEEVARKSLPAHVTFIGGHPMAGSEKSGPGAADPYLFQNAVYVLATGSSGPTSLHNALADFLTKYLGCRNVFLQPEEHDKIAATVSHVPHMLAVALVNLAQQTENSQPGTLELAAGGFRDLTRIATAPYSMWHDILSSNKEAIGQILDECIAALESMKDDLRNDSLEHAFTAARNTRTRIPLDRKGFIHPLHEVLVLAKDQPGVIASISQSLADKGTNIRDIEVLKMREGEGGTIRLGFDSREIAAGAVDILNSIGFSARERK